MEVKYPIGGGLHVDNSINQYKFFNSPKELVIQLQVCYCSQSAVKYTSVGVAKVPYSDTPDLPETSDLTNITVNDTSDTAKTKGAPK